MPKQNNKAIRKRRSQPEESDKFKLWSLELRQMADYWDYIALYNKIPPDDYFKGVHYGFTARETS